MFKTAIVVWKSVNELINFFSLIVKIMFIRPNTEFFTRTIFNSKKKKSFLRNKELGSIFKNMNTSRICF